MEAKKLRYASLTPEQQAEFDSWNTRQQSYCLFRAQGINGAESYRMAGYKCNEQASQNAYILEHRIRPRMPEIIEALKIRNKKFEALKENSELAKALEEKAKGLTAEQKAMR